ncbi:golgin subfamily A member 6-like protein 2 [Macrobrachium nipponense]|uniref:golgin subfamily A member 6-like protein 2 n=1 Tax=Macrobrachium nipponense TaxID=159736 RepID=UPI0030C7E767
MKVCKGRHKETRTKRRTGYLKRIGYWNYYRGTNPNCLRLSPRKEEDFEIHKRRIEASFSFSNQPSAPCVFDSASRQQSLPPRTEGKRRKEARRKKRLDREEDWIQEERLGLRKKNLDSGRRLRYQGRRLDTARKTGHRKKDWTQEKSCDTRRKKLDHQEEDWIPGEGKRLEDNQGRRSWTTGRRDWTQEEDWIQETKLDTGRRLDTRKKDWTNRKKIGYSGRRLDTRKKTGQQERQELDTERRLDTGRKRLDTGRRIGYRKERRQIQEEDGHKEEDWIQGRRLDTRKKLDKEEDCVQEEDWTQEEDCIQEEDWTQEEDWIQEEDKRWTQRRLDTGRRLTQQEDWTQGGDQKAENREIEKNKKKMTPKERTGHKEATKKRKINEIERNKKTTYTVSPLSLVTLQPLAPPPPPPHKGVNVQTANEELA